MSPISWSPNGSDPYSAPGNLRGFLGVDKEGSLTSPRGLKFRFQIVSRLVLGLALLSLAACGGSEKPDKSADFKAIQGTWKAVGIWSGGLEVPKFSEQYLTFDGKRVTFSVKEDERWTEEAGTFVLDPKATPKQMDVTGEFSMYAIYSLDETSLTVCSSSEGRPMQFSTRPSDRATFLVRYEKSEKLPEKL